VELRAFERWIDEGWSPWRMGYGIASLIALAVTVYGYVREPHHPGAIWWLTAAVAIIALWALGEMLRWRIKCRRLLIAEKASSPEPLQAIRRLLTDGKELQADIANHMSWWGTNRLLPQGVPGRIVRWEGNVNEALINQPEIRDLFQKSPELDVNTPISGPAFGRLEYELIILESVISNVMGNSNSKDAVARVESSLTAYFAERVKGLQQLHEEGCALLAEIISPGSPDSERNSEAMPSLKRRVEKWDNKVRATFMYWADLNRFRSLSEIGQSRTLYIWDIHERVEQELEALQTAMSRLPGKRVA
jgi:hypothetical protein